MARSGVYHTAAAETEYMHKYKPEGGTMKLGEFWAYNNWDFNALGTIFNQETGKDLFDELKLLGDKLGMEDFERKDGFYYPQLDISKHPAYHFAMSARDAARLGQLYLQMEK